MTCLVIVLVLVVGSATYFYMLHCPDLNRPVATGDKIDLSLLNEESVMVGAPLFGYPAPLESYIPVFTFKKNEGVSLFEWVDGRARAEYYLPLYSYEELRRVLFLRRTSSDVFSVYTQEHPNRILEDYLSAKMLLEEKVAIRGASINDFRLIRITEGEVLMVLADTSDGIFGVMNYSMQSGGALLWPFARNPSHNFTSSIGKVMNERELRNVLTW